MKFDQKVLEVTVRLFDEMWMLKHGLKPVRKKQTPKNPPKRA